MVEAGLAGLVAAAGLAAGQQRAWLQAFGLRRLPNAGGAGRGGYGAIGHGNWRFHLTPPSACRRVPLFPDLTPWHVADTGQTGYDHTWFVLTRKIIEREFAPSESEQNPDLAGKCVKGPMRERLLPGVPLLDYASVEREVVARNRDGQPVLSPTAGRRCRVYGPAASPPDSAAGACTAIVPCREHSWAGACSPAAPSAARSAKSSDEWPTAPPPSARHGSIPEPPHEKKPTGGIHCR